MVWTIECRPLKWPNQNVSVMQSIWTSFLASFLRLLASFIRNWLNEKKKFKFHFQVGFLGPPAPHNEAVKLPSPLIGILSEFSSSWKVPNVGSRLWLLQGHNLSTIVYYTMKSAKLSNAIWLHTLVRNNTCWLLHHLYFILETNDLHSIL